MSDAVSKTLLSTQTVRLWKVNNGHLEEVEKHKLDLEERLEKWIASDISMIASNLIVIGRQIQTDYGGIIDLLCLDEKGDTVIIELKRDKTPREITAQILDYASWVQTLTPDRIESIAIEYLKINTLEEAFSKINRELPESLNEEHRMLIVGSEIDSSSRRIINYLAETHRVPINAATFNYFKDGQEEYVARTFLIEQSRIDTTIGSSKRLPNLTFEKLKEIAEEKGVGETYEYLFAELPKFFQGIRRSRSSLTLTGQFRDIKQASIMNLYPPKSEPELGLYWEMYDLRFREYFGISKEKALSIIPSNKKPWSYATPSVQSQAQKDEWSGYTGYINIDTAKEFVKNLSELNSK